MNKKLISALLALCVLASLLAGCGAAQGQPSAGPTKPAQTEIASEAPATDAPASETPATDLPEQTDEPTPPEDLYFVRVADESCDRYSDGYSEILFREQTGDVICRSIESGAEQTLFTIEPDDTIFISLIGVTENRLYFGWNEVEDWWGVDVYSVDYSGRNRSELGSAWDPSFEDGWLLLLGFRSDVSPTELLLIDRDDQIAAADASGAVWDAVVVDRTVYYLSVENMPESWPYEDPAEGWNIDLIRIEPNSDRTVVNVFGGQPSAYSPAFFRGDVICFFDTNEFYDLFTLEPTTRPED